MSEYKPILSNEEMNKIELPQAEFIYNNAIKVLEEIKETINNLHKKADKLFFYILTITTGLIVLYFLRYDILIKYKFGEKMILFFIIYISILMGIYLYYFIFPRQSKTIYNSPHNTLTKRALQEMKVFYLVESIDIQEFAIPFNAKQMKDCSKALKIINIGLVMLYVVCLLFLIYV